MLNRLRRVVAAVGAAVVRIVRSVVRGEEVHVERCSRMSPSTRVEITFHMYLEAKSESLWSLVVDAIVECIEEEGLSEVSIAIAGGTITAVVVAGTIIITVKEDK